MSCNFCEAKDYFSLFRLAFTACHVLCIVVGCDATQAFQFRAQILNYLGDRWEKYEAYFLKDFLFGIRFACDIEYHLQQFLQECVDKPSIAEMDSSYYDLSHSSRSVQHNSFRRDLLVILSTPASDSSKTKNFKVGKEKEDSDINAKNPNMRKDWSMPITKNLGEAFSKESLKELPIFKEEIKLCRR